MNRTTAIIGISALSLASQFALAETEETKSWSASAELGFLHTDGNSETETLNAKFDGKKQYKSWEHHLVLEALNSSANDVRSSEKYMAGLQSDYAINDRSYFLSALDWEKDRYSSFDYQASLVLGYGYKVLVQDDQKLSLEVAPGYRVSEFVSGDTQKEGIVRLAERYFYKLSETSSLNQSLSYEWGDDNAITRFNISITSQVAGDLSMKAGYGLKHNSEVPSGAKNTSTETSVTLVYSF
jgi:putative salt-induced outer membrane protein